MKTIIITGASSGIGKETALLFASRGWQVAATMRNPKNLTMFEGQKNIRTYLLDVNDRGSHHDPVSVGISHVEVGC